MRKRNKKYKKELQAAKADIKRLMCGNYVLPCDFCRYGNDNNSPCAKGDIHWCNSNAEWKGTKVLQESL